MYFRILLLGIAISISSVLADRGSAASVISTVCNTEPTEMATDDHIAATPVGIIVTSAMLPTSRLDITCSMVQNGRVLEFLGLDDVLLRFKCVDGASSLPPPICTHH